MANFDKNQVVVQLKEFRDQVKRVREGNRPGWEATKNAVSSTHLGGTLFDLTRKVQQSSLPQGIKEKLLQTLDYQYVERIADLPTEGLKELTGMPATKAVRALCLMFAVGDIATPPESCSTITSSKIEEILKDSANPYDLLLHADAPSVLDLGAGDLTFQQEVAERYLPKLRAKGQPLVLHALDRLRPDSQTGGVYHVDPARKKFLEGFAREELDYRFWGGVDLIELSTLKHLQPHYTMVTCHAPANPTFAYEPSRLSPETIRKHLAESRGEFRKKKVQGEEMLEVLNEGRVLTFPPWKFDILGPLALLDVMIQRGGLCLLTAIDREVFWETLAQLLDDERYRPRDTIFSPTSLKNVFGPIFSVLTQMPIGRRVPLADLAEIRTALPQVIHPQRPRAKEHRLRYVEIRRGATFEGLPNSFTARQFAHMKEEEPPWWIILVPEEVKS